MSANDRPTQTAEFRVSRNRSGRCLWWRASEAIPLEHTDIRPATEAEADLMRRILTADAGGRMPALSLGERLGKMMEGTML
jgi:hypothetical protein